LATGIGAGEIEAVVIKGASLSLGSQAR
jgi:hypothetical protein